MQTLPLSMPDRARVSCRMGKNFVSPKLVFFCISFVDIKLIYLWKNAENCGKEICGTEMCGTEIAKISQNLVQSSERLLNCRKKIVEFCANLSPALLMHVY